MKNVSVILVAVVLLFGTSISTAAVETEKEKLSPSQEISKLLKNPNFLVENDVDANVTFVVNEDNEMVILTVETEDSTIEGYIKNRLNYEKLEAVLVEGKEYKIPVRLLSEE